jgi:pilus assembly protein CpaF
MSLLDRVERLRQAADKGAVPAGAVPAGAVPAGAVPAGAVPAGAIPAGAVPAGEEAPTPRKAVRAPVRDELLTDIQARVQVEVIKAFQALLDVTDPAESRTRITEIVDRIIVTHAFSITRDERLALIEGVLDEITGLGPLEPLLRDPTVTEVMVNGPNNIYVERAGKIQRVDVAFLNNEHVERIIDRIISPIGRHVDETSPRVDARLPDGSRVNAIIEPLSLVGPVITIRRFSAKPYTVNDLVGFGTATAEMFDFLRCCVLARLNIFVSGGTGSGKTTLLNVLSSFIPSDERIVTIEDAAELQLRQDHVVTLEARPANIEGMGEITIRDLLRNSLHMRPDRLIVGECRSGEALDMIQAMTTGHDGSLSTGHANSARDMLRRLETMILMAGYELPLRAIREQIVSAVDLIVHTARLKDGSRRITNITEVYGIEDDEIMTQDIFSFEQTDVRDGKVEGVLKPTGIRPYLMGQFKANGIELPPGEFGIPAPDPNRPSLARHGKGRLAAESTAESADVRPLVGYGRAVRAGGMVYVSSVGPLDPETGQVVPGGIKEQTRQCMSNLKAKLEGAGSSLDKVVWASWSLREQAEFDQFNEEWVRWFPADSPVGQGTLMPVMQRRAGFRISIGVIAEG